MNFLENILYINEFYESGEGDSKDRLTGGVLRI